MGVAQALKISAGLSTQDLADIHPGPEDTVHGGNTPQSLLSHHMQSIQIEAAAIPVRRWRWHAHRTVFVLGLIPNTTAVITSAGSLINHPTAAMISKCYGVISGSLAIIFFPYEYNKLKREAQAVKRLGPIDEVPNWV